MATGFKQATVNASDIPATQTDFPAYVDLSRLGITTLAEAQSVRVYADSGKTTEWAREIVSATEMHVKIPSLTSTTSIYVDWDGVSADYAVTDTYGRNAVWSDYTAVYHFETITTDSTGSGYTLTNNGSVGQTTGKLNGQSADFGSTNTSKYLTRASNLGLTKASPLSITSWFTIDTLPSVGAYDNWYHTLVSSSGTGNYIRGGYENNAGTYRLRHFIFGSAPNVFNDYNITLSTGTWYHGALTWDASTVLSYHNGTQTASQSKTGTYALSSNSTEFGSGIGSGDWHKGKLDEMRYSASTLSANWITTEYNNQSDEAGFWGTWTDAGGGGGGYRFVPQIRPFVGL